MHERRPKPLPAYKRRRIVRAMHAKAAAQVNTMLDDLRAHFEHAMPLPGEHKPVELH